MCGLLGPWSLPFILSLDWALLGRRPYRAHVFSFLCLWAFWLLILSYHFIAPAIVFASLFISCYPVGLRANAPTVPAHFFINLLLRASLTHFPYNYLFWALLANIPTLPAHFIISFIRFPRPIYFFFIFFTLMGFLLDLLGFLDPITTSLSLIIFRVYWPLSQPNEFTNSVRGLPQPIYFLFTFFYSCRSAGHQSCHFSLLVLLPYFLTIFPFLHFLYCWASSAIEPFVKSGHLLYVND